jgi:c(7)-type cytochrome triheme protein
VVIDRLSTRAQVKPVLFSHLTHRQRYTCSVCHSELEFAMVAGTTEITEDGNRKGAFCGACHDGKTAFAHTTENCARCHGGDRGAAKSAFARLRSFPKALFGNRVDWSAALAMGLVKPVASLAPKGEAMAFDKQLNLESEWDMIPPAIFPHTAHTPWLDCGSCHPGIFNIKKKTTKHFSMVASLGGAFCGECHRKVAFPLDDCKRCHPLMR